MSTTLLTLEHDPGTLTNNIGTALNVVLDDGSMLARGLLRLSKGVRPAGVPGFVHTAYKYILLLILASPNVQTHPPWSTLCQTALHLGTMNPVRKKKLRRKKFLTARGARSFP